MKKIKIELDEYDYDCADGCCTNYGTIVTVNGEELTSQNKDVSTIIRNILSHIGYDVEVVNKFNGEEY
jgi:hypothetical protein